jgi:hypothetical protein
MTIIPTMRDLIKLCEAPSQPTRVRKKASIPAPNTPAFKAWFGASKAVDRRGRPLVLYHGTFNNIEAFDPQRGTTGLIFFSTNPRMANGYAASRRDMEGNLAAGAQLIPVYLRIVKPYDYRLSDNEWIATRFYRAYGYPNDYDSRMVRIALYGRSDMDDDENPDISDDPLDAEDFTKALNRGDYPALEMHDFLDFLQSEGYDGIVTNEVRAINFGVFNANQIKSVFAKEFNLDSDHLSETNL